MNKWTGPDGENFAVCLTHDVDRVKKTYQAITHFLMDGRAYHLTSIFSTSNPYWTFDKIMEIEEKHNVRSTFFFLNESKRLNLFKPSTYKLTLGRYNIHNQKIIEVIKKLNKDGWEIGVHGSYDSYQNKDLILREKNELEGILGKPVLGIRQHYLNLDIPNTWELQREVGFKYDSSFGFRNRIGFRGNKIRPFRPFDDEFLEIPLTIMDGPLFKSSKGIYTAWRKCENLLKYIEKKKGLLTVLWHTDRFNDREYPNQMRVYEKIIEESLKRNAWVTNCREATNHEW